jgi:hypothetical protein
VLATAKTPTAIVVDATNVYWADAATSYLPSGSIWKLTLSGGSPVELASKQLDPWALAVDSTSVYWANNSDPGGSVSSVPIAGGTAAAVVPGLDADCVSLALTDAEVVWSQVNSIVRVSKTGGSPTTMLNALAPFMTTDGAYLYWTTATSPTGTIEATALSGDGGTVPLANNLDGPLGITLRDGNLYWVNRGWVADAGSVMTLPADGGTPTTIASGSFHALALATDATDVYFVDVGSQKADDGAVLRVPRNGGAVTVVAPNQGAPVSIAVDANAIYWANQFDGTIMRLAK